MVMTSIINYKCYKIKKLIKIIGSHPIVNKIIKQVINKHHKFKIIQYKTKNNTHTMIMMSSQLHIAAIFKTH